MSGKGSGRRPQLAPDEQVTSSWDAIFGKNRKPIKTQEEFTEWLIASMKEKQNGGESEPSADMR